MAKIYFIVPVLLLTLFVQDGEQLLCWMCSSDLDSQCADSIQFDKDHSSAHSLVNCDANTGVTYPYMSSSKSACKSMKKYMNGQLIVIRGCTWKRSDDFTNNCPISNNAGAISSLHDTILFCETCEIDGCNNATLSAKTLI